MRASPAWCALAVAVQFASRPAGARELLAARPADHGPDGGNSSAPSGRGGVHGRPADGAALLLATRRVAEEPVAEEPVAAEPEAAKPEAAEPEAAEPGTAEPGAAVRSGLNNLFIFSKLREARSRLYRRQILQVNIRWKALDEIYKMYILLHRSDSKNSAKKVVIPLVKLNTKYFSK